MTSTRSDGPSPSVAVPDRDALDRLTAQVSPPDAAARAAATARQGQLTKPPGALGLLEDVSIQLAGIAATCPPPVPQRAAIAVFAADHGVHAQGVSPWPQEVTAQMVANFLGGGAAVTVLAREVGAEVVVVDVGVATPLLGVGAQPGPDDPAHLRRRRVRPGTADLSTAAAMTSAEALAAIEVGAQLADELVSGGVTCLMTGDMGIANTTASAALIAAFTGRDAAEVTGRGTGIDNATLDRKVDVVRRALALHADAVAGGDPVAVLAAVGGLEHAAMVGFVLAAAARRVPVVLDGVIAGAAALVVQALCPDALGYCIAGHRSAEPGHTIALAHLGLTPLVDLGLRLGEGTGAVLALPLVRAAARVLAEMATFDSAGVTGKDARA
ncbi:MAG: nicotinate-nucleotide--dimethylbenzimidazole phosphoribosyltransferase [Kineosporiaceae bacterium]